MGINRLAGFGFYIFLSVVVVAVGYSFLRYATNTPPVEEIGNAREALAAAKDKQAGKYAGERLKDAEFFFEQALLEWKKQNSLFFLFRDYSKTAELALKSYNHSLTAFDEANESFIKLKSNAEVRLNRLRKKIDNFEKYYKNLDLTNATMKLYNKGRTSFTEAQIEYAAGDYHKSLKLLLQSEESLSQAEKQAHLKLAGFYKKYSEWEKNVRMAFDISKRGQTVFLIDKLDASLIILKSGKEHRIIPVEFGDNWMSDKTVAGDKATPEGIYKVQAKKDRTKTRFYKALLLDYPNKDDRKKYQQLVHSGIISKNKDIGGLIEIHGEGGKGIHWTDGCVALDNNAMDYVFNQSSINTPVVIVGARQTLEDYLN